MSLHTKLGHWVSGGCLVAFGLLLLGCATETNTPSQVAAQPDLETLVVGETLRITLTGPASLPQVEQRVKEDGTITLQHIGSVQAAGKKVKALEDEIQKLYVPKYFQYLTVNIQYADRFYYVGGQVRAPGKFQYVTELTILKAIDAAGGFTDYADKKVVIIKRATGKVEKVDCIKALASPNKDVPIYPNDKIEVKLRWM